MASIPSPDPPGVSMIDLTVILTAKDSAHLAELRSLLAQQVQLSRAEPGCVRFEAYESGSVPGTFILIERWESQAALDEHRKATGFTTIYAPKVLPLVDRVPHVCTVLAGT
jgi:quinol monooxygenase YgiN